MTSSFVAASIGAEHLAVEGGREGRREVHRRRKDAEEQIGHAQASLIP